MSLNPLPGPAPTGGTVITPDIGKLFDDVEWLAENGATLHEIVVMTNICAGYLRAFYLRCGRDMPIVLAQPDR
ncbi:hypothetical protein [Kineococcus radiotolerans]|uniref:Uncharacterized protein n=1 Tax=Kineococcus radiotolerans (strain ATCC BAA-149 / DSM 14245 / SRS30216) TaxID=266940 RepID=A6W8V8_KINRD|nr:hypothetical protein [Kineococcus radiotolerans]ABS03247.1 hypothetical protein Krad_1761 [Kineococcus radiotolerans SRS30216 = ATCC BAA-149]